MTAGTISRMRGAIIRNKQGKALGRGTLPVPRRMQKRNSMSLQTVSSALPSATTINPTMPMPGGLPEFDNHRSAYKHATAFELVRGWTVLSTCGITPVVSNAELMLSLATKVFGSTLVNSIVKPTFFAHFCGGEDQKQLQPMVDKLMSYGVSPVLVYSAEGELEAGASDSLNWKEENLGYVLGQMDAVDQCFNKGISPIKPSALCDTSILSSLSSVFFAAGISPTDLLLNENRHVTMEALRDVESVVAKKFNQYASFSQSKKNFLMTSWADLLALGGNDKTIATKLAVSSLPLFSNCFDIGAKADKLDQGVLVDAEYYSFQPAIDFLALQLQRHFNRGTKTRFFNTFQCYLKETDDKVDAFFALSNKEGFNFGAKMVRGAYLVHERKKAAERGVESPVHETIEDTHSCYNRNAFKILNRIKTRDQAEPFADVVLATHNRSTVECVLQWFEDLQLSEDDKKHVRFAQLMGMGDNLTYVLGSKNIQAMKLVPYGPVSEVMPYLVRRAQENSSLMGAAKKEKHMMLEEIKSRVFGST